MCWKQEHWTSVGIWVTLTRDRLWWLSNMVSETAALVRCSRYALIFTYETCSNEGPLVNQQSWAPKTCGVARIVGIVNTDFFFFFFKVSVHYSLLWMLWHSCRAFSAYADPCPMPKASKMRTELQNWTMEQWKDKHWCRPSSWQQYYLMSVASFSGIMCPTKLQTSFRNVWGTGTKYRRGL